MRVVTLEGVPVLGMAPLGKFRIKRFIPKLKIPSLPKIPVISNIAKIAAPIVKAIPTVNAITTGLNVVKDVASGKNIMNTITDNAKGYLSNMVPGGMNALNLVSDVASGKNILNSAVNAAKGQLTSMVPGGMNALNLVSDIASGKNILNSAVNAAKGQLNSMIPENITNIAQNLLKTGGDILAVKNMINQIPGITEGQQEALVNEIQTENQVEQSINAIDKANLPDDIKKEIKAKLEAKKKLASGKKNALMNAAKKQGKTFYIVHSGKVEISLLTPSREKRFKKIGTRTIKKTGLKKQGNLKPVMLKKTGFSQFKTKKTITLRENGKNAGYSVSDVKKKVEAI
mgnify:CR=1 FL=1